MNWDEIISTFCATGLKVDRPFVIWWRPAVQWVWDWKPCAGWPGCYRRIQPTNSNWLCSSFSPWPASDVAGINQVAEIPGFVWRICHRSYRLYHRIFSNFWCHPGPVYTAISSYIKDPFTSLPEKKLRREDFNSAEVTIINTVFNNRVHSFNSLPPSIHFGFSSTS